MSQYTDNILQNFPKLSFCSILDKSDDASSRNVLKPLLDQPALKPWFNWFLNTQEPLDWIRTKFPDQQELIVQKIGESQYLIIVNEVENPALLINFIRKVDFHSDNITTEKTIEPTQEMPQKEVLPVSDPKLQEAVRIQRMIIPKLEEIKKSFKQFFVVHQQQDLIGGDFYWYKTIDNCVLLALVDCTGHSVEGAMTSMVCNSLLNQSMNTFNPESPKEFVYSFYDQLNTYNAVTEDAFDYGIGAEIGLFTFNFEKKKISFTSTGIAAYVRTKQSIEFIKSKKAIDATRIHKWIDTQYFDMQEVTGIYSFTDGLVDQFDALDKQKLGRKGVLRMIEQESEFNAEYYKGEIQKWKGNNMQYDDITLLGMAI